MTAPKCPSCGTTMDEGFIPDIGHMNMPVEPKWSEGAPQRSFWTGITIDKDRRLPIVTYRCSKCGLLQSYARAV
jgi:hypothetical protein